MPNASNNIERFERLLHKTEFCWIWRGSKNPRGYGIVNSKTNNGKRRREGAHRVAYRLYCGDFDQQLQVCHLCDNPSCVNPNHLFLGTQQDNMWDKVQKGHCYTGNHKGEANTQSHFVPQQVLLMRKLFSRGQTITSLYQKFGSTYQSIWAIINRKTWTHI